MRRISQLEIKAFPKILEDSAVGLMELVSFGGVVLQTSSAGTDFMEHEKPQF